MSRNVRAASISEMSVIQTASGRSLMKRDLRKEREEARTQEEKGDERGSGVFLFANMFTCCAFDQVRTPNRTGKHDYACTL